MDEPIASDLAPGIAPSFSLRKSSLDFPVVGLGASAGGLEALQNFFDAMPDDNGMAFAVVMHLSPHHDSHIAEVLQHHTRMPVIQVNHAVPVQPNHVYVIPPNSDLFMDDGQIRLAKPLRVRGPHIAIDLFFRTLAEVHETRAICAVMSGTGSDGAVGLKRIKELGGIAFAQAPDDAKFTDMPEAAITTDLVDFILPAAEMPKRLIKLWHDARNVHLPTGEPNDEEIAFSKLKNDDELSESALQTIISQLRNRTGHDFRHYKRATVLRRIGRRLQVCGVPDLSAYASHMRKNPEESSALLQDLLISVTNFFRDREAFGALERKVIPELFKGRPQDEPIRVWIPGCATGEEAYSISILLREAADKAGSEAPEIQIFASDIDERALTVARRGRYPSGIAADISPKRLTQYFHKEAEGLRINKALREPILFAAHNVLRDPPFSRLDLICCRNLLIYVGREAQTNILEMFRFALRPGGYLFLGTSESADAVSSLFTVVDKKHRIFRANPHAQPLRNLPLPSFSPAARSSIVGLPVHPGERPRNGIAELHAQAVARLAMPSILLDEKLNILHLSDGAGRYLEPAGGLPTTELLPNVMPSLRIDLRAALFQQAHSGEKVQTQAVAYESCGRSGMVFMSIFPVPTQNTISGLLLLQFEETATDGQVLALPTDPAERQLIARYEEEVEKLKAYLRNTVEQADISTADLKATNEELQAINEELRSATEELETSKEELQSANEELITVNAELKSKVDETAKVNDDLQNFIMASEIATLFVDRDSHIKRFTPQAASVFNVIAGDIDRPLLDITSRLLYPDLAHDLKLVFEQLQVIERPVDGSNGSRYLARIRPYRTMDDKIAGAVLTFIDVTELRTAQQALLDGREG